ncbi:hypothetical protein ACFWC9_01020 [Streptomyces goshikiensis]|uniref:hypothetical protein n=1 Tax=Streptomyces goshikiensis TaxID=1942 RepID=UPI003687E653
MLAESVKKDHRLLIEGQARLRVSRKTKAAARARAQEGERLWLAQHRETVRLELLAERLADARLAPVWWVDRYADLQFAAGDPETKVKSVLKALEAVQQVLRAAESESMVEEKARLRRKVDELFHSFEDPQTFTLAMQVVDRALQSIGVNLSASWNAATAADPHDGGDQGDQPASG